jgi:hypothetical protein
VLISGIKSLGSKLTNLYDFRVCFGFYSIENSSHACEIHSTLFLSGESFSILPITNNGHVSEI